MQPLLENGFENNPCYKFALIFHLKVSVNVDAGSEISGMVHVGVLKNQGPRQKHVEGRPRR